MRPDLRTIAEATAASASALLRGAVLGTAVLAAFHPSIVQPGLLGYGATMATSRMPPGTSVPPLRHADFGAIQPSVDARAVADWIASNDDNRGATVVIVDKKDARLYVFDGHVRVVAASPVLLGGALGDASVPGIGERPMALVRPEERTTPAGRFVAERGRNARGEDVVWVDYDAAVSMHRVITTDPAERRLERLASPTPGDNRISYGCINVPVAFYEAYIRPAFVGHHGVVYVLPELSTIHQVFGV